MAVIPRADAGSRPLPRFQVLRDAHLEAIQVSASSLLTPCRLKQAGGIAGSEVLGQDPAPGLSAR